MRGLVWILLAGGCGFSVSATPVDGDDVPDAGPCTSVADTCAGPNTLRSCRAIGDAPVDTACAWGCAVGTPDHCAELVPAGGALSSVDLEPVGRDDVVIGPGTIDGDTGDVTGTVAGVFDYQRVGNIAVFRANSLRVTGRVALLGSRAIAFAIAGDVVIEDELDVRGTCVLSAAGPGGFPGGPFITAGSGPGGGGLGPQGNGAGAGGGGHGAAGGNGGNGNGTGATGGGVYGDVAITTLRGGSGGGGGGGGGGNNGVGVGGGGGGAVQLASNTKIVVASAGVINAGGCGGKGSNNASNDGSGGGGAGGTILLEAPTVEIHGWLAVNGGGGGGCKDIDGSPGLAMRSAAPGGDATVDGGPGGYALSAVGEPGASNPETGGGGGGGVGRIRVNTRDGAVLVPGPTMSPGFDDVPTTATRAIAAVQ